jgi:hypothetical protein
VTRSYQQPEGAPFRIFCEYPVLNIDQEADECVSFDVEGEPGFECCLRLIPLEEGSLPKVEVRLKRKGREEKLAGRETAEGHREYHVPGGSTVVVDWRKPKRK